MQKLIKKMEDLMISITFAEAGEYDLVTSREETTASERTSDILVTKSA